MPSMTRHRSTSDVNLTGSDSVRPLGMDAEPSLVDLAGIEAEWPLIEAELAVVDAEIHLLARAGGPSVLDWRRLRRAEQRVLRETAAMILLQREGGQAA